jgi:hypothetical protein
MADQRLMQMLTKRAIMDDPYALHGATRVGDTDTMRLLLDMGRDVDAPGPAQLNVRPTRLHAAMQKWRIVILAKVWHGATEKGP